jgi:hypothetical protein
MYHKHRSVNSQHFILAAGGFVLAGLSGPVYV